MRNFYVFATHFLLYIVNVTAATEVDRLLPSSVQSQVEVHSRLDGRALYATIVNNSQYVITDFFLSCVAQPQQEIDRQKVCAEKRAAARRSQGIKDGLFADLIVMTPDSKNKSINNDGCQYITPGQNVVKQRFQKKVIPDTPIELYAEISTGMGSAACSLYDLRGREKKWLE